VKKAVLFLLGIAPALSFAQSKEELNRLFSAQNDQYQSQFNEIAGKASKNINQETVNGERSRLAGFANRIPVFLESDDTRANQSANVPALQDGTLPGINNLKIEGDGINILVMDGGRIFEKHKEFGAVDGVPVAQRITDKENGTVGYSGHATNVAGIIGAIGIGNFAAPYGPKAARGVLTKSTFDSYTFSTTPAGNNYQKLNNATTANVSNHSYGINLGWTYASSPSSTYPQIGWYWIGNYELNNRDTYSGSYYTQDANYDKIVYSNPNHVVIKSAGNYYGMGPGPNDKAFRFDSALNKYVPFADGEERPAKNCSQGYYCIGWGSLAKNIIVVGSTDQLVGSNYIYTSPSDVSKASYSSAGPRRDGAVKPDISAVGSNHLVATYSNATNYASYATGSGTSYSAPVVSGVAGAVTELARHLNNDPNLIYKADEMKALLTHTANEAGNAGPDVWYGWGFVDASRAAGLVIDKTNDKAIFERRVLTSGTKYIKEIAAKEGEALKATISWVDPAAVPFNSDEELQNNLSSRLVNDLDLRIIDTTNNQVYYPWRLDANNPMAPATKGDNTVDNVEQVLIENPVAGRTYRIEVSNKGSLVNEAGNAASQAYALVVTGLQASGSMSATETVKKSVAVYPTVTDSTINVLIPDGGAKTVELYDTAGKRVLSSTAKSYQTIDVSSLPAGVYIIKIISDGEAVTKKIIRK